MIYHCDKGEEIKEYEITAQGFLEVIGTVAHVGYLLYPRRDGGVDKEYVPIETLFNEEHIKSTETSVITLNHPPLGVDINPNSWGYSKGSIKKTIKNEDAQSLMVKMIIGSQDAIASVQNGITCLSMGYSVEREQVNKDEYVQTKRICNHIAIVQKGRAGRAKIHLDNEMDYRLDSELINFREVIMPVRITKIKL